MVPPPAAASARRADTHDQLDGLRAANLIADVDRQFSCRSLSIGANPGVRGAASCRPGV
jgi:hypothetical protein